MDSWPLRPPTRKPGGGKWKWGPGAGLLRSQVVLTVQRVREPTSLGSVTPCLHRPCPPAVVLFLFGLDLVSVIQGL